jgi:hypothetical protein
MWDKMRTRHKGLMNVCTHMLVQSPLITSQPSAVQTKTIWGKVENSLNNQLFSKHFWKLHYDITNGR